MMPMRFKKVFKVFMAWQDEQEEQWLGEMARSGWLLVSYSPLVYTFVSAEPGEYIYKLDYKVTSNADMDEYLSFFEDAGWEHVAGILGWHYFRTKSGNMNTPDIYSDSNSKVQKYKGLMRTLLILLVANLFSFFNLTLNISDRARGSDLFDLSRLMVFGVLLLLIYAVVRTHLKIKSLENKL